jgi:hypothetical protein
MASIAEVPRKIAIANALVRSRVISLLLSFGYPATPDRELPRLDRSYSGPIRLFNSQGVSLDMS